MGRSILAIVVAFVLWSALWLGGSTAAQSLFPGVVRAGQPLFHAGALLGLLLWSVIVSVISGYACAALKRDAPMKTVWTFGLLQVLIGSAIEISGWALAPAWYHVAFLALLVPSIVWGGKLRTGGVKDAT